MDAINPSRPYFLLGKNDLNYRGLVVNKEPKWVDIEAKPTVINNRVILQVNEDGTWSGQKAGIYENYTAVSKRYYYNEEGENAYLEAYFDEDAEYQGMEIEVEQLEDKTEKFKDKIAFEGADFEGDDMLYITPKTFSNFEENPFKLEKRSYPVDFGHPISESTLFNLKVPEGYAVEELPESVLYTLLGNAAKFTFQIQESGGFVQMSCRLKINQVYFRPLEYLDLKVFLDKAAEKLSEQIVLKKV